MIEALGTSTPTSITVVATSTLVSPGHETGHRGVFLARRHLAVDQPDDALAQGRAQLLEPFLGGGQIDDFAFLDQRADPIGLPPLGDRARAGDRPPRPSDRC